MIIKYSYNLKDLRSIGSGNPGATNAVRAYGIWAGFIVFLIDSGKIFIPIFLAKQTFSANILCFGICIAVFGHCFSPFLKFKGGKGVATLIGGVLAFDPLLGCLSIGVWILSYLLTELSALSALLMIAFILGSQIQKLYIGMLLSLLIVFLRHHSNWKSWITYTYRENPLSIKNPIL
jgi:glycerol-3-phosphate acyltransferase PlsY